MPVIVGPTPQEGVQPVYQLACSQTAGTSDDTSGLSHDRAHARLGRLDKQLVSIHTDVLPEEVEPLLDMRDDRLIRRKLKAAFSEEPLHERADLLLQHLSRGTGDNEVVAYLTRFTF